MDICARFAASATRLKSRKKGAVAVGPPASFPSWGIWPAAGAQLEGCLWTWAACIIEKSCEMATCEWPWPQKERGSFPEGDGSKVTAWLILGADWTFSCGAIDAARWSLLVAFNGRYDDSVLELWDVEGSNSHRLYGVLRLRSMMWEGGSSKTISSRFAARWARWQWARLLYFSCVAALRAAALSIGSRRQQGSSDPPQRGEGWPRISLQDCTGATELFRELYLPRWDRGDKVTIPSQTEEHLLIYSVYSVYSVPKGRRNV